MFQILLVQTFLSCGILLFRISLAVTKIGFLLDLLFIIFYYRTSRSHVVSIILNQLQWSFTITKFSFWSCSDKLKHNYSANSSHIGMIIRPTPQHHMTDTLVLGGWKPRCKVANTFRATWLTPRCEAITDDCHAPTTPSSMDRSSPMFVCTVVWQHVLPYFCVCLLEFL